MFFHRDKSFILYGCSRFIADKLGYRQLYPGFIESSGSTPAGCKRCADSSGDCTCRLKLLNQDSGCRLKNLSTESELSNEYLCR